MHETPTIFSLLPILPFLPLAAFVVEADKGSLSVPISGQMESKLSPNNPPIDWEHAGGPPWYRQGKSYPFVNSNFHPDFGTASVDMRRAWAALGYPEVDGVVTDSWGLPFVPYRMYKVADRTGEVTVLSSGSRTPTRGARVRCRCRCTSEMPRRGS